jgi:hypothetical protein
MIDFLDETECPLSKARGYIVPLRFEHPLIIYQKQFRGRQSEREFEIEYRKLDRWRPLLKESNEEQTTGQSANRPKSDSEGGFKPQPETEGRSL